MAAAACAGHGGAVAAHTWQTLLQTTTGLPRYVLSVAGLRLEGKSHPDSCSMSSPTDPLALIGFMFPRGLCSAQFERPISAAAGTHLQAAPPGASQLPAAAHGCTPLVLAQLPCGCTALGDGSLCCTCSQGGISATPLPPSSSLPVPFPNPKMWVALPGRDGAHKLAACLCRVPSIAGSAQQGWTALAECSRSPGGGSSKAAMLAPAASNPTCSMELQKVDSAWQRRAQNIVHGE